MEPRTRVITRRDVDQHGFAAVKESLEAAHEGGSLDSYQGVAFDGRDVIVMLDAGRMLAADRDGFACEILVCERMIDRVLSRHAVTTKESR